MAKDIQSLDLIESQQAKYAMLARYASLPVLKDLTLAQITAYRAELVEQEREIKLAIKASRAQLAVLDEVAGSAPTSLELKTHINLLRDITKTNLANLQLKSRENATRTKAVDSYVQKTNLGSFNSVKTNLTWLGDKITTWLV